LVFLSWLAFGIIDRRLVSSQETVDATIVWVHRGPLFNWKTVRVHYRTVEGGRFVTATLHTGSSDADGWTVGTDISISYNRRHPSAVSYYDDNGNLNDTREDFWVGVGLLGIFTGLLALTALAVRFWACRRYKRCFTDTDDAMPATFLGATRGRLVSRVNLETPTLARRVSVWLLRGQDPNVFLPGEKLEVHGSSDGTGPVVLSSRGWERTLLGRGQYQGVHLAGRSPDEHLDELSRQVITDDMTGVDALPTNEAAPPPAERNNLTAGERGP
jgi:hypothetical protein